MFKKIIDIAVTASLVISFTAGAAWALNRHQMHEMGAYMINSAGFACDDVNAMAPEEADHVFKVRCGDVAQGQHYSVNARTGEVWKVAVGPR